MKLRAPITDKIDVRNFNDELKHAIVKRSRVRYMPTPQEDEEQSATESGEDAEALAQANEIFERLQREAEADEKAKEAEWIAKLSQEQEVNDSDYNATTGSYSGAYGKGNVSEETKDLAANILGEKADSLAALISQNQVD
ncbi:hypothetical protein SAMN02910358_00328 [Lachnospiraceae bacterium XBB1006]|nr:hypothetical protein SAMN02910358_00328 [Lachnospiraceae bacterium XBB1006]